MAFHIDDSVRPPDEDTSTLFISAGMQRYKTLFADPDHTGTVANIQSCLRLTDLDELGDATHALRFDMLGLFSFRQMSMADAVRFWHEFLACIGIKPTHVTVHPDRIADWRHYHPSSVPVREDSDCTWSDGGMGGYCTEFFVGDVEIGNVVNPLGTCIDAGFGLQRLMLILGEPLPDPNTVLADAIFAILDSGYTPNNRRQGYAVRRLLRMLWRRGGSLDHPCFEQEIARQKRLQELYGRLKNRHADKDAAWWFDTLGIVLSDMRD